MIKKKNLVVREWRGISNLMKLFFVASAGAAAILPILMSEAGYQPLQTLLAVILFEICLYPTARYFARRDSSLPAMPILCLAYALQFALPFFTHDATIELSQREIKGLDESDVTAALLIAIVGICALQLGYYWFHQSRFKKAVPTAVLHLNKSKAIIYCVLAGVLLPLLFTFKGVIPEEFQQPLSSILRVLENQILVVIAILGWIVYSRDESKFYAVWLYALVAVAALKGISSGLIEQALIPIGVLFIVKWYYTRRLSIPMIAATLLLILFLSPVKSDFRQQVWYGEAPEIAEMSSASKMLLWVEQATDYWADTIAGTRGITEATASASGRADFIHQVAHIYSMTPSSVPYQFGATYSYFAITMIPRVIWPDKPEAGSANNFYAVSYGITSDEGIKTTTFGVSILGEAFINFGWYGVVLVMMLQGLLIALLEQVFGGARSGAGGQAVFIAFFIFFLNGIGSSAEILFGNLLQNLLCGYFLLLWAREKSTAVRAKGMPLRPSVANRSLST
jgi:O-antigen polysaccharide polymerase Wzy